MLKIRIPSDACSGGISSGQSLVKATGRDQNHSGQYRECCLFLASHLPESEKLIWECPLICHAEML
jgi:hypothetical protein